MANEIVRRFVTQDGNTRINIVRDEFAENPRDMTDEPLHCEDWSRGFSIMLKHERESKSEDTGKLIRYLLARYGDNKNIIKLLKDNFKGSEHDRYENGLSYDRSRREWIVWSWQPAWTDYQGNVYEAHWSEEWAFCINIYDVDIYNIADVLSDEQIDLLCNEKYWTDGVKIMSYGFGYYGEISFDSEFSTDSEGICWLEKNEFLKYSGCKEEYWNGKSLDEIEWLIDELKAWCDNDVYGFVVEEKVVKHVSKEYVNQERTEEYDEDDWEQKDCCFGFYGELDKNIGFIISETGYNKEELQEVDI